jgi:hypothetical protein
MSDSHALLNDLLAKVQGIELASMCEKLKAIVACAHLYIEAMAANPQDESLVHLAEVRFDAAMLRSFSRSLVYGPLSCQDENALVCAPPGIPGVARRSASPN